LPRDISFVQISSYLRHRIALKEMSGILALTFALTVAFGSSLKTVNEQRHGHASVGSALGKGGLGQCAEENAVCYFHEKLSAVNGSEEVLLGEGHIQTLHYSNFSIVNYFFAQGEHVTFYLSGEKTAPTIGIVIPPSATCKDGLVLQALHESSQGGIPGVDIQHALEGHITTLTSDTGVIDQTNLTSVESISWAHPAISYPGGLPVKIVAIDVLSRYVEIVVTDEPVDQLCSDNPKASRVSENGAKAATRPHWWVSKRTIAISIAVVAFGLTIALCATVGVSACFLGVKYGAVAIPLIQLGLHSVVHALKLP